MLGIARYIREHQPWLIHHGLPQRGARWLSNWDGDGIIARVDNEELLNNIKASGLPAVDCLGALLTSDLPIVHIDNTAIGRLAAEHLLERGFKHYAFIGYPSVTWSEERRRAFNSVIREHDFPCAEFQIPTWRTPREELLEQYRAFLAGLPKPAGVMVAHDELGQRVLSAAMAGGIAVPDDVGIVGVDNYEPFCEVSYPPLSSVASSHEAVGFETAALLDRLMAGEAAPSKPRFLEPRGVVTRLSTDVLAIEDPHIASAARFIREHACDGIGVEDVVSHVPFSHTVLQQRFKKAFGRTIHEEIVNVRVKQAKQFLIETNQSIAEVAERVGISNPEYFGSMFKAKTGQTPAQFRRKIRGTQRLAS